MQLTEFQQRVVDTALSTNGAGKFAAQSAVRHLERAFQLIEFMPEVAVFLDRRISVGLA